MSTHSSIIYRLLEAAELHREWRGYTIKKKDSLWFLNELMKEEHNRLTKPGNRGMRELLVSEYCYSPNLEKQTDLDNTVTLVPNEKLVNYLIELNNHLE